MKKLISLLSITMVLLASCSNDEFDTTEPNVTESNTNGTVLKKTVAIINGGTAVTTGEYIYDGNKLAKIISSDDKYVTYFYTSDLITSREFYNNGILSTKEIFEYNANKQLVNFKRVKPNNTIVYRAVYVYNTDGTITVTGYKGALVDQNSEISKRKVFLENGQASKIETYLNVNGSIATETTHYTFDSKNSPFNDILGFDKLTFYDSSLNGNAHNVTGLNVTSSSNTNSGADAIQYTYNAFDYPVTAKEVDSADKAKNSTVYQYFYE
jgi:hypothetical protein